MALVKSSERTSRKPCNKPGCGSTATYWAQDTDAPRRYVLIDADAVTRPIPKGGEVPAGHEHALTCGARRKSDSSELAPTVTVAVDPAKQDDTVTLASMLAEEPAPAPTAAPNGSAAEALQALLGALAPSVNPEQIRAIVREELEGMIFPTRTIVVRESTKQSVKVKGPTHYAFAEVLSWLAAGEHVLMVGPAGTGKSTIAKQCADSLDIAYGAISLNPQTPKSDLFGYKDANGNYHGTVFRERCERGGLMNLDEFDNGHGGIMAGLNMALANGCVAFPDGMVTLHDDFLCVAGANTDGRGAKDGYIRQRLDYATLDRFTVVHVGYDEALESELVRGTGIDKALGVKVLTAVRQARANVAAAGMDLVYSPRASLGMARGLLGGMTWERVVTARLRRGLTEQEWAKVGSGVVAA